jgi:hypothetical protein
MRPTGLMRLGRLPGARRLAGMQRVGLGVLDRRARVPG